MEKIISVIFKSDFGFFRKPDANDMINLSYNMIHKPAILGILGAIIGLDGYKAKGEKPEYLTYLQDIKIAVEPIAHDKGNYQKTVIKYSNTIGYANKGATYLTEEATLIKPAYKIYILLDISVEKQKELYNNLKSGSTEYIPYFGKNEFNIWWDKTEVMEYSYEQVSNIENAIRIHSLFKPEDDRPPVATNIIEEAAIRRDKKLGPPFMYFERIPTGFEEIMMQYKLEKFAYSNFKLDIGKELENLYLLNSETYVQLN